jgi:hypothetical protein
VCDVQGLLPAVSLHRGACTNHVGRAPRLVSGPGCGSCSTTSQRGTRCVWTSRARCTFSRVSVCVSLGTAAAAAAAAAAVPVLKISSSTLAPASSAGSSASTQQRTAAPARSSSGPASPGPCRLCARPGGGCWWTGATRRPLRATPSLQPLAASLDSAARACVLGAAEVRVPGRAVACCTDAVLCRTSLPCRS